MKASLRQSIKLRSSGSVCTVDPQPAGHRPERETRSGHEFPARCSNLAREGGLGFP